ncbi:MAG: ABC transporter substrate-binding protein [Alphaproteobacteria bacterium]|nr:ABC transporter substrate-binding protein [Alphaproteobacteria bacterium]
MPRVTKWLFILNAIISSTAMAQVPAGSVLKVIPSADVQELDPTRGANLISRIYSQMVFDTLFALDHTLSPKPMMIDHESVSDDRLRYSFTLRAGLKFHDGSPVTARDVVASLNRWMDGTSVGGQLKRRVAALTADDDRSVTLTLKEPFGLVEFMLAGAGAPIPAIMREKDANRPNSEAMTAPIGSGPFKYVAAERVSGHRVVFERFADYAVRPEPPDGLAGGKVVKVDRVEWTIIPDPATAADAIAGGEADFWEGIAPDLAPYLRQRGVTVKRTNLLPSVAFVRPNFQIPPFSDVRARRALALLFDQHDFMAAVAGDNMKWDTCYSFTVCGGPLATDVGSDSYRKPDIEKAKALLAEAGYKGEKLTLLGTPNLPPINAMSQVAEQRLRDAGIPVDLKMVDFATMFKTMNTPDLASGGGSWNLFTYYAIGSSWYHPLMNVALDLSCEKKNWAGFPCDAEGEALRQTVLSAPDEAARKEAFMALQRHLWDFIPYVPAGQFDVASAYRDNLAGVLSAYVQPYWNIEKH